MRRAKNVLRQASFRMPLQVATQGDGVAHYDAAAICSAVGSNRRAVFVAAFISATRRE
jgi:hypothetical protein